MPCLMEWVLYRGGPSTVTLRKNAYTELFYINQLSLPLSMEWYDSIIQSFLGRHRVIALICHVAIRALHCSGGNR